MNSLPEAYRPFEVSKDKWVWPDCIRFKVNRSSMFCADVFRAVGTTFIRMAALKHLDDFRARRYVPAEYFTAAEWHEMEVEEIV